MVPSSTWLLQICEMAQFTSRNTGPLLSPRLLTSSVTSGPRDWTHAKALSDLNRVVSSPAPEDMSWLLCSPVGAVGVARA